MSLRSHIDSFGRAFHASGGAGLVAASALLVVFFGCGPKEEPTTKPAPAPEETQVAPRISIPDIAISPSDESPIVGRWEVVDYRLTPVSAIDETTALDWLGLLVIYSADHVGFEAEMCDEPSFREHEEVYADYFEDFEVNPVELDIQDPVVDIVSVDCYGEPWSGPGSEVIKVQGDSLVVVYDGVFLTMEPYSVAQ